MSKSPEHSTPSPAYRFNCDAENFIIESNRIEGILRPPTNAERDEFVRFMSLLKVTIEELQHFVSVYQPGALLRDKFGLDVRVGNHLPPRGGGEVRRQLEHLLEADLTPYQRHITYETIHPFTDGNGRSGRMLWAWEVRDLHLGFLRHFYYQTLSGSKGAQPVGKKQSRIMAPKKTALPDTTAPTEGD